MTPGNLITSANSIRSVNNVRFDYSQSGENNKFVVSNRIEREIINIANWFRDKRPTQFIAASHLHPLEIQGMYPLQICSFLNLLNLAELRWKLRCNLLVDRMFAIRKLGAALLCYLLIRINSGSARDSLNANWFLIKFLCLTIRQCRVVADYDQFREIMSSMNFPNITSFFFPDQ